MACNRRKALQRMVTVASAVLPSPAIGSLFGTHSALTQSGPNVTATHEVILQKIVVRTRAEAEYLLQRLNNGESFSQLAREYSVDASGPKGGNLGAVRITNLSLELKQALQGVCAGEVTSIVKSDSGYCILKILRPLTAISGFDQAEYFFARIKKTPGFGQDFHEICDLKSRAVREGEEFVKTYIGQLTASHSSSENPRLLLGAIQWLSQTAAYQGNFEDVLSRLQEGNRVSVAQSIPGSDFHIEEEIGATYLRRSFEDRLHRNYTAESFLLPIEPRVSKITSPDAESAADHFLKSLRQDPDDLEVKWLLNITCMTLNKYPNGVPEEHLIAPQTFESVENSGSFEDIASPRGLDVCAMAGGVIMDDFDNDGNLDLIVSSAGPCDPLHYFHNNGDGTFSDWTVRSGLANQLGGFNLVQADYNNDGWLDFLVLRGAWEVPMRKSLLRNKGDGTFTDVTRQAGLALPATSTQTAAWADFDNDGHIDLFVGNENTPSQLFHNNGDGTFTEIAHQAGVDRVAFTKGVTAGDYDNDGYMDIYVSNLGANNFLYRNNRNGTFTNVANDLDVARPINSFPVWFFDYNNDGWLDLFVSSYCTSVVEIVRSLRGLPVQAETMRLYENLGGRFRDATRRLGLQRVFMPMGANFGDIDNDGFLDFYLGTGHPSFTALVPNVLLRNNAGQHFSDITFPSRTGHLGKGHGIAFGDIDNDGKQEIYVVTGGMVPSDCYRNVLFRTAENRNNWIKVKLVGVKTNRAAIGARIKVTVEDPDGSTRSIYRVVSSGGSFGASPLEQHIGLGKAHRISALEIWWPVSNTRQAIYGLTPNRRFKIREFAGL
jgi:FG-GAP-like repeat/ASPIC and UnbV/PPIC-type PPIASE domain